MKRKDPSYASPDTVGGMKANAKLASVLAGSALAVGVGLVNPATASAFTPIPQRVHPVGHGGISAVQVVTVNGLLFPNARQVLRIQRRRRLYGAKKWSSETVYAITDLPAEQADAAEIAAWARGHWIVANTVHWVRDVVFGEDESQVRTRNAPAVRAAARDLIRGALKLAGYVNTAAGRRAHTERHRLLALHGIT